MSDERDESGFHTAGVFAGFALAMGLAVTVGDAGHGLGPALVVFVLVSCAAMPLGAWGAAQIGRRLFP